MAEDGKYPQYHVVDGFRLPLLFQADVFRDALKYRVQDDDIFIITYPKNGTTWVQMLVFLIYRDGRPPYDAAELYATSPFLELSGRARAENRVRPGAIKAHLPFQLTPRSNSSKAKYIFVLRNPKDTLVSFFHHTKHRPYGFENGDFDTYFEIFMNGANDCGDYFDFILSWYEHRNDPNVLFVYYENMKNDIRKEVLRLANFIDPAIRRKIEQNNDVLELIVQNSSFQAMKFLNKGHHGVFKPVNEEEANAPVNMKDFIRKGIVGDWRNTFSEQQNERMNQKIELKLKGTEMYSFWKEGGYL